MMFLLTSALFMQKIDLRKTLTHYIPLERKFNSEQLFCLREITKMNSVKGIFIRSGHGMRKNCFDVKNVRGVLADTRINLADNVSSYIENDFHHSASHLDVFFCN